MIHVSIGLAPNFLSCYNVAYSSFKPSCFLFKSPSLVKFRILLGTTKRRDKSSKVFLWQRGRWLGGDSPLAHPGASAHRQKWWNGMKGLWISYNLLKMIFFFSFFSMGNPLLGESIISMGNMFSRIVAEGSRFTLWVWGVDLCSPDAAFMFATAQPFATVRDLLQKCILLEGLLKWWQRANRIASLGHPENHFAWQGQYLVQVRWCRMPFCVASTVFGTHNTYTLYTFHTPHCTLIGYIGCECRHSTFYTPNLNFTLHTLHLHFTLHTLFFRLSPQHSTLYTPHSLSFALCTFHF